MRKLHALGLWREEYEDGHMKVFQLYRVGFHLNAIIEIGLVQ